MKVVHWFSLAMLLVGLALSFLGLPDAGGAMFVLSTVIELAHSALTGKQTNDGGR